MEIPKKIYTGLWNTPHIQGIAVDEKREYIYFSFTTTLVKATLSGEIIGSVTGLYGHLGCLSYNKEDNRVYASLEYKNDVIGKSIQDRLDINQKLEDSFYIAIFDGDKINHINMDAEKDGIMTCVYLKTVVDDYSATVQGTDGLIKHRYDCSGIDGLTFGPEFGEKSGRSFLCVSYGIYGDNSRADNDYQVILQYDICDWKKYKSPLSQANVNIKGPEKPRNKYFLFTGNTSYGIQNLEYDSYTNNWLVAVYKGSKPQYPNWSLYIIDGLIKPKTELLAGCYGETGLVLSLWKKGLYDEASGIFGWESKYGTTGLASLGDGRFYISHEGQKETEHYSEIHLYKWTGQTPCPLQIVSESEV